MQNIILTVIVDGLTVVFRALFLATLLWFCDLVFEQTDTIMLVEKTFVEMTLDEVIFSFVKVLIISLLIIWVLFGGFQKPKSPFDN